MQMELQRFLVTTHYSNSIFPRKTYDLAKSEKDAIEFEQWRQRYYEDCGLGERTFEATKVNGDGVPV